MVFPFHLLAPRTKRLHRFQTLVIVVVVIIFEVAVVVVEFFVSTNLASIDALSIDIALTIYLVPPPI